MKAFLLKAFVLNAMYGTESLFNLHEDWFKVLSQDTDLCTKFADEALLRHILLIMTSGA